MVSNSKVHPYNGLGKLISTYEHPISLAKFSTKGTAFLITPKHIMTAAHNLYSNDMKIKKRLKASKMYFYPEPLLYKQKL